MLRPVNYEVASPAAARDVAATSLQLDSQPLEGELRMVGSAKVELRLSIISPANASDAAVFVYLEDVGPGGYVFLYSLHLHCTIMQIFLIRRR